MREYEEQGEEFGDAFARYPDIPLNQGPFTPERLDLAGLHLDSDSSVEGAKGADSADDSGSASQVNPSEEEGGGEGASVDSQEASAGSASPTPPSSQ